MEAPQGELLLPVSLARGRVEAPRTRAEAGFGSGGSAMNKSALVRMAELFPHALARQLNKAGIDPYVGTTTSTGVKTRRVREERLRVSRGNKGNPLLWKCQMPFCTAFFCFYRFLYSASR